MWRAAIRLRWLVPAAASAERDLQRPLRWLLPCWAAPLQRLYWSAGAASHRRLCNNLALLWHVCRGRYPIVKLVNVKTILPIQYIVTGNQQVLRGPMALPAAPAGRGIFNPVPSRSLQTGAGLSASCCIATAPKTDCRLAKRAREEAAPAQSPPGVPSPAAPFLLRFSRDLCASALQLRGAPVQAHDGDAPVTPAWLGHNHQSGPQ